MRVLPHLSSALRLRSPVVFVVAVLAVFAAALAAPAALAAVAPSSLSIPSLSGVARECATLTADPGVWAGDAPITFSYAWQKCDSSGAGCGPIAGATSASYLIPSTAPGSTLRVVVTATNPSGSAMSQSFVSGVVAPAGTTPANASLPVVSGTVQEGKTLTATSGSWDGKLPISYSYAWQRCDATGASCSAVAGATSAAYTLITADVGSRVRVSVTASSSAGINKAASGSTGVVVSATAPAISSPPTISGTAKVGQALSVAVGSWTGSQPITFTYTWSSCDLGGGSCVPITGATASTYTPVLADVGHSLRASVTATNSAGSATSLTAPSDAVSSSVAGAPANTALPAITGTVAVGEKLTATAGTWSGAVPLTFAYSWQSCDGGGNNCTAIGGANTESYSPTLGDMTHKLRVEVVATNGNGSASATSAAVGAVAPPKTPYNIASPVIYASSPTLKAGDVVTASVGSWLSSEKISYTYQWTRCTTYPNCAPIPGAARMTYTITAADVGHPIFVQVKASTDAGVQFVDSQPTPAGISLQLRLASAPTIGGTATVGSTLTAHPGTWVGSQPVAYTYQWTRCTVYPACTPIPGAKRATYTVTPADVGHALFVQIKAITKQASAFANSPRTAAVTATGSTTSGTEQAGSVILPNRLVISGVQFQPARLDSRAPFVARFRVTDTQGRPVQGALVYALGIPYSWVTASPEVVTGPNGWATEVITPTAQMPLTHGTALVMFIRARKGGDNLLAGVSSRRLVQIVVGSRSVSSAATTNSAYVGETAPIGSVALPSRLVISDVKFQPTSINSRASFIARFRITDTAGQPVQGALVYALGLPYSWVANTHEVATDANGWATELITPTARLPLRPGTALVMFVRARKPGENLLGGVSNRRLVQIVVR